MTHNEKEMECMRHKPGSIHDSDVIIRRRNLKICTRSAALQVGNGSSQSWNKRLESRIDLPHHDDTFLTTRDNVVPIGSERHRRHRMGMPMESSALSSALVRFCGCHRSNQVIDTVPQAHHTLIMASHHNSSLAANRKACDHAALGIALDLANQYFVVERPHIQMPIKGQYFEI
jgi:hypothetical protein